MRVGRVGITAGHSGSGIIGHGVVWIDHIAGRVRIRIGRIHRTNAGRVHQPFPDHHDPMHMVGHHHEFAHINMRHVVRYRIPTLLGQFADRRWMHHTIRNSPEPMAPVIGANGQVIGALLGVIVSGSSNGVAFR